MEHFLVVNCSKNQSVEVRTRQLQALVNSTIGTLMEDSLKPILTTIMNETEKKSPFDRLGQIYNAQILP
jgi:hypothetical protein